MWELFHSRNKQGFSKSAAGLLAGSHQADIRMRPIARLLWLDDNKSAAIQVVNRLDASYLNNLQKVCKYQVVSSPIFTDFT